MAEELKIVLAVDGADKVATALDNTSEALKDTAAEAKKAGDALNRSLRPGAAQAQNSLSNLSRVAQDAPYGFIGIANNINPLLESFQRLQAETGGTSNAFKAMVQSLAGPAGLGLAVGIVSSLLVSFGGELFKSEKEVDTLDQRLEALKSTFEKVNDDFNKFVAIADKASKLNDINIKARFADDITQETLTRQSKFITISEKLVEATDARRKSWNNYVEIVRGAFKTDEEYDKARKAAIDVYNEAIKKENELIDARKRQAALNRLAVVEEKRTAAERLKSIDTISKTIAKLKEDLRDQKALSLTFNVSTIKEQAKLVESAIEKIVTKFNLSPANTLKLKVALLSGNNELLGEEGLGLLLSQLEAQLGLEQFTKNLKPLPVTVPVALKFDADISSSYKSVKKFLDEQAKKAKELAKKKSEDFKSIVLGLATSTAEGIGTLIGEGLYAAITGSASGLVDAFKGLFTLFADAVAQLGKYAILYSGAIEALKNAIAGASGVTGIAVGIGLIALSALIKAAIGGIGKTGGFAVGTRYAPGGMSLVGERGPELVNLPRGSQVVPAAQTSAMLGGRQQVEVFGVLRGQDIYFSNKKYSQTYNRQT